MADAEQDERISDAIARHHGSLLCFVRRRVADSRDAQDVLQDVFFELVEAYRMMQPIDQVTAWLYRVARNRITDLFRRREREARRSAPAPDDAGADIALELLPSHEAGPAEVYARKVLLDELAAALAELPAEQREVFVAHELAGTSFRELARSTGVPVNTLLARKRYAVLRLRRRLRAVYDELYERGDRRT